MSIITIDDDFSITIPVELRDALGWKPGAQVAPMDLSL